MSVGERDPHTGHMTTGHEWNGIKELNTPVPKIVYFFLIVTTIFGLIWMFLMPSWPFIHSYYKGVLGLDQKQIVAVELDKGIALRAPWVDQVIADDFANIQNNPELMENVLAAGHRLFGDNCAACHGINAAGNPGYPNLAASSMLWGATPETIQETITVGINSTADDTRSSQMLAFGSEEILTRDEILAVTDYVRTLSDPALVPTIDAQAVASGAELFADNCSSCHGEDAKGNIDMGAPDLTDQFWIYGGSRQMIFETVYNGRQGHMPSWATRLTPAQIKILTLYILDLRAQQE